MSEERFQPKIIAFFETIAKYYGSKTEITEGICSDPITLDANLTTWSLSEFELIRSAYRKNGTKFMMEGPSRYYEISADRIIDFKQLGRNHFEFIELYGESVYRITKVRFHYKY